MKPNKCSLCKGNIKKGKTDFTVKIDHKIMSITDVPAYICDNCGEAYFTPDASRLIDKAMIKFSKQKVALYPILAGEISYREVGQIV